MVISVLKNNNKCPKVVFELVPMDRERRMFKHFLQTDISYFRDAFYNAYPEFNNKDINLEDWLKQKWFENKKKALESKKVYEENWQKQESEFMFALSQVINTEWFDNPSEIKAYLSFCVVYPRFLEEKSFFVHWNSNFSRICGTVMHELTHFLYFKKFKELFPGVSEDQYNGHSDIRWILSEILVSIILNDARIPKLVSNEHKSYNAFYEHKIGKKTIMQTFEDKYKTMITKQNKQFDEYLTWAYTYAKKHKKELDVVR